MIELFPNGLTPKEIIRIPNKTSTDLSIDEVVVMIEADSSLTEDGNEHFSSCALDEFLNSANLEGRPDLQQIKTDILKGIYLDTSGKQEKKIDTDFLAKYAQGLRVEI